MTSSAPCVGNLTPADDLMHPVTEHGSHNESMFFNFFDDRLRLGGFVRIGNRVNERHAEMTFCVFMPDGEVLLQWGRPPIGDNSAFDAAGMRFDVLEPARRLAVSYQGEVVRLADPDAMREPGHAFRNNPRVHVDLRLEVSANGPMIGDREGRPDSIIFLDGVGHYQQPIVSVGELVVGDTHYTLNARGVRDHSWGPRIWHSIHRDRSLWISFGPELTFIACKTWLSATGRPDEMGCVVEQGKVTPLRRIEMRSRYRPGTFYHDAVTLDVEDIEGRHFHLPGEVLGYVPLRHRKEGRETVYLGQAMTKFRLGDRETIGLSEYFDAESATAALVEASHRREAVQE
jgi:hypothetical protein